MKNRNHPASSGSLSHSRRRFVQGVAVGGIMAGLGLVPGLSMAAPELRGREFDLEIAELPVNFTGQPAVATVVNGQLPAPTLRWREGDTVTVRVTNRLKVHSSIHWHGIILPTAMDGVPGLSFGGIAPGETFVYRFKVGQSGTYWYHSHSGFQEQTGIYGAIVIEPAVPQARPLREHVVLLSDWTDEDPERVMAKLKTFEGYYNYARPTVGELIERARKEGWSKAWQERMMWDGMRMSPRDLADVSGATYTYLLNGMTPQAGWTGLFDKGEKVLLRIINGSAMSYFDLRIPGLKLTVVAADGQPVHPVTVDEIRIGTAETFDVMVEPQYDIAYTLFAQSMDRSGFACGTLAPRMGMRAEIPALDPVPTLTMADMGMAMDMPGMKMDGNEMHGMERPGHDEPVHAAHGHSVADQRSHDMSGMEGMDMGAMKMPNGSGKMAHDKSDWLEVHHHPATENGPGTAMHAQRLSRRLDDPGAGLRNNGRRVLTYADLQRMGAWGDQREPGRTIELHLTGNMQRYMWSFDGVPYADAEPIRLTYGERVRILLVNDTMMDHPIHLHGMWSDLENQHGELQTRKHTVRVPPGHAVSYRVTADAVGRWAYHCHLAFHMNGGMFREVNVS